MKIEISSFPGAGDFDKERLVLKVLSDTDVGEYVVFCSARSESNSPLSGAQLAFWFPDAAVRANDLVVLYTKHGSPSTKDLGEGRTAHFFYWGLSYSIWGGKGNIATLLMPDDWKTHTARE